MVFCPGVDSASTGTCKSGIEQLRLHIDSGLAIPITLNARLNLTLHITDVDVTLALRFSHESNNFHRQSVVLSPISKFEGVEVNNHVTVFGSELHRVIALN